MSKFCRRIQKKKNNIQGVPSKISKLKSTSSGNADFTKMPNIRNFYIITIDKHNAYISVV